MADNIKNFNEVNEDGTVDQQVNVPVEPVKRKGFIARWKELKWWQKSLIFAGAATLLYIGGKWVFTRNDSVQVQPVKVVVPMDPTNEIDNKVQDLVNAVAESAKEEGLEVTPF